MVGKGKKHLICSISMLKAAISLIMELCNSLKDNIKISEDISSFDNQIYNVDLAVM